MRCARRRHSASSGARPVPFYYLTLCWAAVAYLAVIYVSRSPFGLALQGTRDNARRMAALGFNVTAHRIAACAFAALIAAFAGVLLVWHGGQISPGTAGIGPVIDILIIAVAGGLARPIGPFIGALIFVILRTFALDALVAVGLDGKRFQLADRDRLSSDRAVLAGRRAGPVGALARASHPAERRPACGRARSALMPTSVAQRLNVASTANALELRGVTRMFGALVALNDVTLSIRPGERRAVLGSNGAGKTTLFNTITGDFPPNSGTIRFFGEDITDFPPHERIRRGLRRTYQISALFTGLSVIDNVYLACRGVSRGRFSLLRPRQNEPIMQSALGLVEAVHLSAVKDRVVAELSYGQQRQLEVALALSGAPRFILFDEPAAGLSPTERSELIEILTSLPGAHRLHHHRARHGRRTAGGRARHA